MESPRPKPAASAASSSRAQSAAKTLFPADSDTHLLDRLNAIYKYRYLMIGVFALVILGVLVRTYTTTPMYRATTSVMIDDDRSTNVAGFNSTQDANQDQDAYFQTQLRILTGRELGTKVVQRLHLENYPEFNGQGPQRTGLAAVLQTMNDQGRGMVRAVTRAAPPSEAAAGGKPTTEGLVAAFLSRVSIEPAQGTRLVNVSVTSSSAEFAARGADTLVEEYVKQNLEIRNDATR